jgi:hypothetical protein
MRRFLKHIFPRVFDDSTVSNSHERAKAHQHSDNSHSWSRKRKQYEQFPEAIELQLVPGSAKEGNKATFQSSTAVGTSGGDMDSHSETAILETKSYTVHWEQDSPSNSFESERRD